MVSLLFLILWVSRIISAQQCAGLYKDGNPVATLDLCLDLPVRATLENETDDFALIYFSPDDSSEG